MSYEHDGTFMDLPRVYGGVDVPHWEQYTGWIAAHLPRVRQFMGFCASVPPQLHVVELREAGGPADPDEVRGYSVHDGVAVVELQGPMTKYGSSFAPMGGTLAMQSKLRRAGRDPAVKAIVMRIDSPGGMVKGTGELAEEVRSINAKVPIVAFCEDLCASAAYYVASQCSAIVANKDAEVGSIGTYAVIDDWSGFFAREGVKTHVIRSGKFKGAGVQGAEITGEQLAEFQREIDSIAALFVDAVAEGRGMSREKVGNLADGRIWVASEAKELGLIDKVGRMDSAMRSARAFSRSKNDGAKSAAELQAAELATVDVPTESHDAGDVTMGASETGSPPVKTAATLAELKAAFPDATADFREKCQESGWSLAEAKDAWIGELRAAVKSKDAAIAEAKAKAAVGGNPVVASGGAAGGGAAAGNAREEWDAAVRAHTDKGTTFEAATRAVNVEKPGLREQMLQEHNAVNAKARRSVAA